MYPTHLGTLVILDGTTAHTNSNMWITHTKRVRLFQEVTGVDQALLQKIVATVKEVYLTDIRKRTTSSINNTIADVLIHLQDNYSHLIPHELLERK